MKSFSLLIFFFLSFHLGAQRFSLLVEAGGLKGQMDGDKIQGFYYNGYNVGIGSYYTFTPQHFLAVKSSFYNQGSRRKDVFQPRLREGFQLEVDLRTIGMEVSYKFDPVDKAYFMGAGLVRHQLVGINYDIIDNETDGDARMFEADQLRSGFTSLKLYYGFNLFERAGIYFSFESAVSDIVKYNFFEIQSLIPYSVSAVFTYEILAAAEVKAKKRPGSKTRTKSRKPKRRR